MRILILGGTSFVGRAIVDALSAESVAIFSRGVTGTSLFPSVPRLIGDRDSGDYASLRNGAWDAVVDVTAYFPWQVGQATDAVGDRAGRYLLVSSHAVFDGGSTRRREPIRDARPPLTDETYGPSKVACEDEVLSRYGDRATIVRPGKVAGPYDNQEGLTYWVRKAARGGRIAVPGSLAQPVQIVDSRALGRLVARLLADDRGGGYTAVGPSMSLSGLITTCAAAAGASAELVPVPYGSAPKPFPLVKAEAAWPTQRRDPGPALAAGMPDIPLARTAADVLAWDRARGEPPLTRGFTDAEEAHLAGGR